jgi:PAS domain S-box-containing protein/putative nucleotidyltransferase with HDIG domain
MSDRDKRDPARFRRAEDAERAAAQNAQLADAAMALLGCETPEDVYRVAGDFIALLSPGSVVVVNEVTPDQGWLITRCIAGLEDSLVAQAAKLFGVEMTGSRWALAPEYADEVRSGRLNRLEGGVAALASRELPDTVAALGAQLFGVHDVFTIGISDGCHALGSVRIITRTRDAVLPAHVIESFARHCYSTLARIAAARELAESAESNLLLLRNMTTGLALHEIILDAGGRPCDYRFLEVNAAFESATGLKSEDVVGRTVLEVLPGTEPAWIERYGAVATTGVPVRFEQHARELGRHFEIAAYCPRPGQFASIVTDITERKAADEALRSSEQRLRLLFDRDPDGIVILDPETAGFAEFNETAHEQLGYTREEFAALRLFDIEDDEAPEATRKRIAEIAEKGRVDYETRQRTKAGGIRHVRVTAQVIDVAGKPVYHCIWRDITDIKRITEALRESQQRLQAILDHSPSLVYVKDLEGRITFANRGFESLFALEPGGAIGKTSHDLMDAGIADSHRANDLEVIETRAPVTAEEVTEEADGRHTYLSVKFPLYDSAGNVQGVCGISTDMTELKRADEARREGDERHLAAIQTAMDGFWFIDMDGRLLEVNQAYCDLSGYGRDELIGMPVSDLEVGESPEQIAAHNALIMERGSDRFESRHRRKDGTLFDVEVSVSYRPTDGGHFAGFIRDITRRKLTEHTLAERNRFIDAILENAPIGFAVNTIDDGLTVLISPNFERIYGVDPDTVGGIEDFFERVYLDPVFREEMRERIMADLASGDPERMRWEDIPLTSATGTRRWVTAINIPLPEQNLMISTVQDVTTRKLAEDEIAQQAERIDRTLTSVIDIASTIVETRDPYTAGHQRRVAQIASAIARDLGMSDVETHAIEVAGLIHDVGKVQVPAEILGKPGAISPLEYELLKGHAEAGYNIVLAAQMEQPIPELVHQHHERCDGSGYPQGLAGDQILMGAKVLAVADVVEAMMSHRPYRPALGIEAALAEIERGAGTQYDAEVVRSCAGIFRREDFELA